MVLSLTTGLGQLGWQTPIVALDDGPFTGECRDLGLEVHSLSLGQAPRLDGSMAGKAVNYLKLLGFQGRAKKRLAERVRDLRVDAIHVNWPNLIGIAGYAARANRVPCLWEMPNIVGTTYPFGINRRIYQCQCRRLGIQPVPISQYTADTLGDRPVKPEVMYLSCDAARFDPQRVMGVSREDLGIPENAVVLGICARITASKGQDRVLAAMLSLGQTTPPLHLVLLGGPTDDAFAESLRATARQAGAIDRLHFVGVVPDPERYYSLMDIPINSRIDPEPFGLSVVEAMMMARPVLVHALGGPAETVIDGVTGWQVQDPSVTGFAAGIRRALDDRPRWEQMGRAAREHALKHFTVEAQAARYAQIVEGSISRGQSKR